MLNGVKQFITTGKNADVAVVFAVTDKAAGKKGISGFIVDTRTPGYVVARVEEKLGQHASDTAQIVFENCAVPAANLLGAEGERLPDRARQSGGRAASASPRRRSAWRARRSTRRWPTRASARASASRSPSTRRSISGSPTWRSQIEAARQLVWHAAALRDAGLPCLKEASMAKLFASEMAEQVCSDAIQIHGGYGYVADFPVERI